MKLHIISLLFIISIISCTNSLESEDKGKEEVVEKKVSQHKKVRVKPRAISSFRPPHETILPSNDEDETTLKTHTKSPKRHISSNNGQEETPHTIIELTESEIAEVIAEPNPSDSNELINIEEIINITEKIKAKAESFNKEEEREEREKREKREKRKKAITESNKAVMKSIISQRPTTESPKDLTDGTRSTQTLAGSIGGSTQALAGSIGGSTQALAGSIGGSTQALAGSIGGSTQALAGSIGGSTQALAGSIGGSTQALAGSIGGSTQALAGSIKSSEDLTDGTGSKEAPTKPEEQYRLLHMITSL